MSRNNINQTPNGTTELDPAFIDRLIESTIDPPVVLVVESPVGEKITISDIQPEIRSAISDRVTDWHPKLGRCTAINGEAIVILPVHTKRQALPLKAKDFTAAPDLVLESYLSRHGTGIAVFAPYGKEALHPAAICYVPNPFFEALSTPLITVIIVERKKPIAAYRYDLSQHSELLETLQELRGLISRHSTGEVVAESGTNTLWANVPLAYLYLTLWRLSTRINYHLSSSEQLSALWAFSFNNMVELARGLLTDSECELIPDALKTHSEKLPPSVVSILEILAESHQCSRTETYRRIQEVISPEAAPEIARFISIVTLSNNPDDPFTQLWCAVDDLLRLFLWNEEQTRCGLRLPWLTEEGELRYLDLDPDSIPKRSGYWGIFEDLTGGGPLFELGQLIGPRDIPINPRSQETTDNIELGIFPRVGNIQEARQEIKLLLEEAASAKQWTIPPGAIVQGPFGPIPTIEFFESPNAVYGIIRDHDRKFLPFFVSPERGEIEIRGYPWIDDYVGAPVPKGFESVNEFIDNTEAALTLLIAAIVRDFWVVEYRERVFKVRPERRLPGTATRQVGLRVVYLPRIKYSAAETPKTLRERDGATIRSAHKVRAHLRQAGSASPAQRTLARRYGFVLPAGFTFVSPHWRGHRSRQVVYRSRTALNALYTKIETKGLPSSRPLWFQFEVDVKNLLSSLGFQAEHCSATRRGDDGVDVFASKQEHGILKHWLVQCKCYAPKNKVGPRIVRELIGSLADENEDIEPRGMVVTTSSLTSGAKKLAEKHGIEWIEGDKFQSLLSKIRDSKRK